MITKTGYSKDPSIQPVGIAITWGADLIKEKGGLLGFIRYFEQCMSMEDGLWLQKCKNKPRYDDLLYVYVIVNNQLKYRCLYAGYETGETTIHNGDGVSWSSRNTITWPRIVMAGPFLKNPHKRILKGFQGFRYTEELF